ncbi:hypothetical protein ACJIZ3_022595 [Penstemon smallii]|uniref:Uncharacterized protein n=1 Tax=Penstemon smallii TaxID=265156 RepID=A0ABD3TLQ6_9LAMI
MGACASRPKDLDYDQVPGEAPAPVDAPVVKEKEIADTVPQEKKDGDEIKKEEALVDLSEPAAQEAPKTEEVAKPVEAKPATEEVVAAAKTETKIEEAPKEEKKEVAESVATPAVAEVAAAPKTEGKTDAPVVKA